MVYLLAYYFLNLVLPTGGSTSGGSRLTVFGSNFGTTSTVSVGGNDCAVVERNQTRYS